MVKWERISECTESQKINFIWLFNTHVQNNSSFVLFVTYLHSIQYTQI